MPFDSTKPVPGALVDADLLRNQFNELKALIDAQQAQIDALNDALATRPDNDAVLQLLDENAACAVDAIAELTLDVSDPPAQDEVEQVRDKINELIEALKGGV
jgi:hypothetical protein